MYTNQSESTKKSAQCFGSLADTFIITILTLVHDLDVIADFKLKDQRHSCSQRTLHAQIAFTYELL